MGDFLADLDDLGGDSGDEEVPKVDAKQVGKKNSPTQHAYPANLELYARDTMDTGDDDGPVKTEGDDVKPWRANVDNVLEKMGAKDWASIAKLRQTPEFKAHMERIEKLTQAQGNDEDGDEYELVVASNESIQEIDTEIAEVYKYLVDLYGTKFPELDSIVTVRTDYVRTVLAIKNEMDITQVELENILPQTQVMVVSVTGTTTSGKPLSAENLEKVMTACDEYLKLVEAKDTNLAFVESRMAFIAPNLSVILGSRIAAQLMGLAGGLKELSKIPACNLQVMGQEKKHLAGFGAKAVVPHTGILYYCDMVQKLPHFLRMKGLRLVAAKAILAARGDSFGSDKSGEVGLKLIDQMEEKFKKWQEPEKTKSSKALPKPDSVMAKKRGGKRARNQKEKLQVTEVRKAQNRMGFASQADEYGDSAMGADFGMLGKSGAGGGRIRAPAKKEQKQSLSKRMRVATQSSGATGGMASSLVFTPVQGIELVNPMANDDKIKAANDKWFKKTSGFASAVPKDKRNDGSFSLAPPLPKK